MSRVKTVLLTFLLLAATSPAAWACAVCGGASDSPMAQGMNWGIFSLLAVIVPMLGLIACFFVFLARKAAQTAATSEQSPKNV